MKRFALFSLFVALVAVQSANSDAQDAQSSAVDQQEVVVHLSHFTDDLHRCFMALKLAKLMQQSDANVTLFLDLEGVRLAERRQLLDMTWGSSPTPLAQHYEDFVEAGGKVVLCPHCAQSAKIGDPALKRHAAIGTEGDLAIMLSAADKILDY